MATADEVQRARALGESIRKAREAAEMTQGELATATGKMSRETINRIELGKSPNVGRATLQAIAEALKTTVAELEGGPLPTVPISDLLDDYLAKYEATQRPTDEELGWLVRNRVLVMDGFEPTADTVAKLLELRRTRKPKK